MVNALPRMGESPWLREIRTLDPQRDCRRIVFLDSFCEFPFDTSRALELAFFKTFASPTIAALLDSTWEFRLRGQKRYDDTDLLISTFSEDGWDGEDGKRALRRMNQIHRRFDIANDDFLYAVRACERRSGGGGHTPPATRSSSWGRRPETRALRVADPAEQPPAVR